MKFPLVPTAIACVLSIVFTACEQAPSLYTAQPGQNAQGSNAQSNAQWSYVSLTPEDAYRTGQISRWQLEQLTGPTPQALQGPSPNSDKNGEVR